MSKVVKGKELFKMIVEGEIDENTEVTVDNYGKCTLGFVFEDGRNLFKWLDEDFELIEDEIDIDSIEELLKIEEYEVDKTDTVINRNKINELVQAVKQLNKEIKSIKEK